MLLKKTFLLLFQRLLNLGVNPDLEFNENRKTRVLNLVGILGIISTFTFFLINILSANYMLASINLFTTFCSFSLLYFNYKKWYSTGYILVTVASTITFCISSLLFHNGIEFYLLLNIGLTLILLKDSKTIIILSLLNAVAFIYIFKYGHLYNYFPPVSEQRRFINIIVWVFFFLVFLQYFKKQSIRYQSEIETKNGLLYHKQQELMQQAQLLEANNHQLQVLNQTKEKLFSIVAHDIRTPIAGLRSSLELFNLNIISKEEFVLLANELSVQVEQLQNNLDNLLHWSQSQLHGIIIHPEKVSLKALILDTLTLLQQNLSSKNIRVDLDITENIFLYTDPNHTKLVLRNLISNAIKFSNQGESINVRAHTEDDMVKICIEDRGIGIEEELIPKLFHSVNFYSKRGTNNEKGSGLGLLLTKEFIEKNAGKITVTSTVGEGTVFCLWLPSAFS